AVLQRVPPVLELARRVEGHAKGLVSPATLFEELGFNYVGPIDGHDLDALVPTLERSEEHTSELQSRENLVCRLLLEKKKAAPSHSSCTGRMTPGGRTVRVRGAGGRRRRSVSRWQLCAPIWRSSSARAEGCLRRVACVPHHIADDRYRSLTLVPLYPASHAAWQCRITLAQTLH